MKIHGEAVPRFARAAAEGLTVMIYGTAFRVVIKSAQTWTVGNMTAQVADVELVQKDRPFAGCEIE